MRLYVWTALGHIVATATIGLIAGEERMRLMALIVVYTVLFLMILSTLAKADIKQDIKQAAKRAGVPSKILLAICFAESSHRDLSPALDGSSLSYGVCQVKLETAYTIDKRLGNPEYTATPEGLSDPYVNAFYAAYILKFNYHKYGDWPQAIEAYNKGIARNKGTGKYVKRVLAYIGKF